MFERVLVFYGSYRAGRMGIRLADYCVRALQARNRGQSRLFRSTRPALLSAEAARCAGARRIAPVALRSSR